MAQAGRPGLAPEQMAELWQRWKAHARRPMAGAHEPDLDLLVGPCSCDACRFRERCARTPRLSRVRALGRRQGSNSVARHATPQLAQLFEFTQDCAGS
jgi:hypothetical protein